MSSSNDVGNSFLGALGTVGIVGLSCLRVQGSPNVVDVDYTSPKIGRALALGIETILFQNIFNNLRNAYSSNIYPGISFNLS